MFLPPPPATRNASPFISVFITNPHLAGNTTRYFTDSVDGLWSMNCTDSCCRPGGEHWSPGDRWKIWRLEQKVKYDVLFPMQAEGDLLPWEPNTDFAILNCDTTQCQILLPTFHKNVKVVRNVTEDDPQSHTLQHRPPQKEFKWHIWPQWVAWRQIRSVGANILNNHSRMANKGRSYCEALTMPRRKKILYEMLHTASRCSLYSVRKFCPLISYPKTSSSSVTS